MISSLHRGFKMCCFFRSQRKVENFLTATCWFWELCFIFSTFCKTQECSKIFVLLSNISRLGKNVMSLARRDHVLILGQCPAFHFKVLILLWSEKNNTLTFYEIYYPGDHSTSFCYYNMFTLKDLTTNEFLLDLSFKNHLNHLTVKPFNCKTKP